MAGSRWVRPFGVTGHFLLTRNDTVSPFFTNRRRSCAVGVPCRIGHAGQTMAELWVIDARMADIDTSITPNVEENAAALERRDK